MEPPPGIKDEPREHAPGLPATLRGPLDGLVWLLTHLWGASPELVLSRADVYHSGTCSRCGRVLTTPESIRSGLGPVCAELAAGEGL